MNKINEALRVIKSGARANKYRVLYPVFGKDIDIICNATSVPGRELGTTDVFVKGRKYQLASEMADDGTWEMTIYNTPDLLHRRFFLKMIGGVHNFQTPDYLMDGGSIPKTTLQAGTRFDVAGDANQGDSLSNIFNNIDSAVTSINQAYNDIKYVYNSALKTKESLKKAINGDWNALEALVSGAGYNSTPWYQQEIVIQQLDHENRTVATTMLNNCFVTSVGPIEYSDESPEITTSTITFAYSGIEYGSYSEVPVIEKY